MLDDLDLIEPDVIEAAEYVVEILAQRYLGNL